MVIYNFIKYLFLYIKYYKILKKVYEEENIIENLSKTFNIEFKQDWIGRIYCIFNPNLVDGKFDPNHQIYSYNDKGLSTDDFVEQYIMTQLNIIQRYIRANNLFELLDYNLVKLDDYDNYLFIMQPITLGDCLKYSKIFAITLLVLIFIGGLIYFI
jgi:hypothetical protein